ncbi:MAG: ATP-binding cassette domain-containing protein, partial [Planctomycetota bacterium]
EVEHRVDSTLSQMMLPADSDFQTLSSGMKRRVLLAAAVASGPDLLMLDEPTNHLDIPSILWLEEFLSRWPGTLMFVTHDRSFLQNLAQRIWEIDRGQLFDWTCDYDTFLKRKSAALAAEEKQNALFDKRLAEEEAWIRQGIKARRTRNEGRVRALKSMRQERQQRRGAVGNARLNLQQAEKSGRLVADVKSISYAHPPATPDGRSHPIVDKFSTTILRGDKIGIIGPNGAGKTTLLRLLLGQLQPDAGELKTGTKLEIAYFDQLRDTLSDDATVADAIADGNDTVRIGDKSKHIIGYLQDFLFTPERARTQIKFLSGGERNRVLLARLMAKPANVIVLDEPTNDLDAETLELLEEQLMDFDGTVLMVSHDRAFLNNIVTSTIVFEPDPESADLDNAALVVNEYAGGYDDWKRVADRRNEQRKSAQKERQKDKDASAPQNSAAAATNAEPGSATQVPPQRLSYKEKRLLEQLPDKIQATESEIESITAEMSDPKFYQQDAKVIARKSQQLQELNEQLAANYEQWESLEARSDA